MRALQTEISTGLYSHIAIVEGQDPFFNPHLHYHPELELVYVKEGYGKRIIGDRLESFAAGEIFFIGSNLAHEWRSDKEVYKNTSSLCSYSIVAYFNKAIFSTAFYEMQESNKINSLFLRAGRGIKVTGETREIIATKMEALPQKQGFEKILNLMEILHILSISAEIEYLVYEGYEGSVSEKRCDRLTDVFSYVTTNFNQDITLNEIAKVVHLTPPAFCRLFKQRTHRPFVSYLNEVRISNACKFLTETSYNISEVAFQCGYKTLSNFNKFFKKSTGLSPKAYREKALA